METDFILFAVALLGLIIGVFGTLIAGAMLAAMAVGVIAFNMVGTLISVVALLLSVLVSGTAYVYFVSGIVEE
jgi:hypothetical protein